MFYLLYRSYVPNTAYINRAKAYWKEIDNLSIEATVVFFLPDNNLSKVLEQYKNIKFIYFWDKAYLKNKYLKYISYFFYQKKFFAQLKNSDKVYIYACADLLYFATKNKIASVYYETTEHPKIHSIGSRLYNPTLRQHLDNCRKVDSLFVISTSLKDYFANEGFDPSKIHIINITVDANRFVNLQKQKQKDLYIAYCGTISNSKDGVDDLIKAFSIVSKKHPNVKLYLIGKTPLKIDEMGNIELVKSLNIEDKVIFTGKVLSENMPQILKNAEILALARPDSLQAQNGFPTKLGEYLLTENPVVVTKVGDIPKFLKHGESALLAEESNPEDFADKLCWALEHKREASVIGEKGAQVAMDEFNSKIETRKLIDVIFNN